MLSVVHKILAPRWLSAKRIVVFEDGATAGQLFPLNVLRPSWEIRAGLGSLKEWLTILRTAGYSVALRPRLEMQDRACEISGFDDVWQHANEPVIFLNGRVLLAPPIAGSLPPAVTDSRGQVLWALVSGETASSLLQLTGTELATALVKHVSGGVQAEQVGMLAADFAWDYMVHSPKLLQIGMADAGDELLGSRKLQSLPEGVHLVGDLPVYIGEGTKLLPTVVLDTSEGPIRLGREVTIEAHCYIKGPLTMGDHGRIKAHSTVEHGCSFGPHCRLSGEINETVIQGYSNKQHAGHLGNSHLGEWVNLGADTTVSNLRNDYGHVKVKVDGKLINSGRQFIGLICGDHTKTGINTMFNTGTVVGVGANVYGAGYPTRFIRSFSWGGNDGFHVEPLERTLESARVAMSRRGQALSVAEEELLRQHYEKIVKQENRD